MPEPTSLVLMLTAFNTVFEIKEEKPLSRVGAEEISKVEPQPNGKVTGSETLFHV